MQSFLAAGRTVLRDCKDDPLALDAVRAYFRQLYFHEGTEALDAVDVGDQRGIMAAIRDGARGFRYPFRGIAEAFRIIDDTMQPFVVPRNAEAEAALSRVAFAERPQILRQGVGRAILGANRRAMPRLTVWLFFYPAGRHLVRMP